METTKLYDNISDDKIKAFNEKLIPNLDYPAYGVRIPELRKIAKNTKDMDFEIKYHEDVLLRGFIIAARKCPIEEKLELLNTQLNLLKTWDETDTLSASLKFGKKEIERAYAYFHSLLADERVYAHRLAVVWIMSNRNKISSPIESQLEAIVKVKNDDYYIAMAIAWAISCYYITDPDKTVPYIEKVDGEVKKMAMQKIRDSRRTRKC